MIHASLWDLVVIIGVPILVWKFVMKPLLKRWESFRGIRFVPKEWP